MLPIPVTQAALHLPWQIFVAVAVAIALYWLVRVARSQ
jgi:hypothetical protein